MKLCIVLCACVAVVFAAPPTVVILRSNYNIDSVGNYRFGFQQSDGTGHVQRGQIRNQGRDDEYLAVQGQYTWVAPNGVRYTVTYTADENGYQPEIEEGPGAGLPPDVFTSLIGGSG